MQRIKQKGIVHLSFFLVFLTLLGFTLIVTKASAYNYEHVNITSKVNVTNAGPEIISTSIESPIILNAGTTKIVYCNATVRDWNGYADIDNVNSTFYFYLNESDDPDDNNVHYTNGTCEEVSNDGEYLANYSCSFETYYYANNGTWRCNISVNDSYSYDDSNLTSDAAINALYALNVTDVIDYGNLSVTDTSENITATITNFGNLAINVSVLGYGQTEGDGIGLVCEHGSNISVENQRFSGIETTWENKVELGTTNKDMNITLAKQTEPMTPITATSYWQLYVPPNPFGLCTSTVRFTATAP